MTLSKFSITPSLLALALTAAAASAQSPQAPQAQQPQQPSTAAQQGTQPSLANTPDAATAPSSPNYADVSFVEDTLKNNDTQVQLSQLAQQKAQSGDVKDFSQKMIQVHTQLNQQLAPLAKQLDVNANQKPSKQQKKEIAQLQQLSGTDFDAAYLQAMAREQAQSLKEFKSHEKAQNPTIQKATQADEPILTQHYQILQKIAETHNVTLASNN